MKNPKIVIYMILSVSIGIIATTPLLMAELNIQPWITHVQGPTAPFNIELVYTNFNKFQYTHNPNQRTNDKLFCSS